jgi:hypothetical protein
MCLTANTQGAICEAMQMCERVVQTYRSELQRQSAALRQELTAAQQEAGPRFPGEETTCGDG